MIFLLNKIDGDIETESLILVNNLMEIFNEVKKRHYLYYRYFIAYLVLGIVYYSANQL